MNKTAAVEGKIALTIVLDRKKISIVINSSQSSNNFLEFMKHQTVTTGIKHVVG